MDTQTSKSSEDNSLKHSKLRKRNEGICETITCFNSERCCGWYKPRLVFIKLIIVFFVVLPTILSLLTYCLCFFIDSYLVTNDQLMFFALMNPFLVFLKSENDQDFDEDKARGKNIESI